MKKVLKRALCGITAFVVAAGAMSYFPADTFPEIARGVTAYAANGTITAADLKNIEKGDGSKESPYEITTAEELLAVMECDKTIYAKLKNDIVINDGLLNRINKETGKPLNDSDSIVCWTPISEHRNPINLDGDNNKISGLYINESGKAGLYASLKEGSFKNLTITDSFVKGGNNVGVLAGDGLYNSSLSADNVKLENTIVRGESYVGGLFGSYEPNGYEIKYTITNCTVGADVTVTGTGDRVGGIASECSGTILYSSSAATVTGKTYVGGVVGYAGGYVEKIWYCHNDGTVKGVESVGGVLGYGDGINEFPICYIYNTGDVSGDNDVAGLVGTARISPKYSYNIGEVKYGNL